MLISIIFDTCHLQLKLKEEKEKEKEKEKKLVYQN
jgi:hypothetical protein